jgi:hypothetical protein
MGQVALGVPVGRDPLVDLVDLDRAPGQVVFCELGKHEPGVWPPLTAHVNVPFAATADRIRCATNPAALTASGAASGSVISVCSMLTGRAARAGR